MLRVEPAGRRRLVSRALSRRTALRAAAGGLLLLGGCGGDEPAAPSGATATAVPTATEPPAPTQPPIASPVGGYDNPERWAGRTLTVTSWGGDYQDAQNAAFFEPFARDTGATVLVATTNIANLRKQVLDETVTWDVVDVPTETVLPLARENILTPIDYRRVDRAALFGEVVMQHGVGVGFFSTVITYAADAVTIPRSWADFWDASAFGAGRALARSPVGTLEFALLAAGQPIDDLYPLDIERAFASLDRIREHVVSWYQDSKQPVQLVANKGVALASAYNIRVGLPGVQGAVAIQWNGGMLSAESWVIPRGAPNADVAMDFINYATRAIPSANFSRLVPYGPVNRDAFVYLDPARLDLLPTAEPNRAVQFVENWNWWADNRDALTERFEEWLLTEPPAATPGATTRGSIR